MQPALSGFGIGLSIVLQAPPRPPITVDPAATPGFRRALSLVKWIKWLGGRRIPGGPPPEEVGDRLPHFTIDSVPGAGHDLVEENAGAVLAIIASMRVELDRATAVAATGRSE